MVLEYKHTYIKTITSTPYVHIDSYQPFKPIKPETESIPQEGHIFTSVSFEACLSSTVLET